MITLLPFWIRVRIYEWRAERERHREIQLRADLTRLRILA